MRKSLMLLGLAAILSPLAHASVTRHRRTPTTTVTIAPTSATLTDGKTQQFTAHVTGTSNTATWSTTDPNGSVNNSGMYTAGTTPGSYEVIVTDANVSATATVTVNGPVSAQTTVSVSPTSATIVAGGTQQFTATVTNGSGTTIWSTTDPLGNVSSSGMYTSGSTAGTYAVEAMNNNVSASRNVTVTPASSGSGSGSSGGSGKIVFQDTFASATDANWSQVDLAHPAQFGVSCSGADYPTCAQITINDGDGGNNILIACTVANTAGCPSNGVNLATLGTYYTYYRMQIPQAANFGAASENFKFTYNKTSAGGNVCYYDGAVESEGPLAIQLRAICDNPSIADYNYVSVSLGTTWHTLEEEYSQGNLFNMWWDGIEIGPYPPAGDGTIPNVSMTDFEPGLYLNGTAGASFTILLNDVQFCTSGRCPGIQ